MSLNGRNLNALIDFDFLVNTEFGLIKFIQSNFMDDRVFKLDMLSRSDREILSLLYSRTNYNPLSIISTEDNMKDIDKLYESFMDTYKKDIISCSVSEKKIYEFVSVAVMTGSSSGTRVSIAVKDDYEINAIKRRLGKANISDLRDSIDIKNYDPLYVKDQYFLINNNCKDITHKNIYFSMRRYVKDYLNLMDTKPKLGVYNNYLFMGKDYSIK